MRSIFLGPLVVLVALCQGCNRAEPYDQCGRDAPCGSDAPLCLANTSPRMVSALFCTLRCPTPAANASTCPGTAACVRLNGGDPVCMKRCSADSECDFANAACLVLPESMGARVCTVRP